VALIGQAALLVAIVDGAFMKSLGSRELLPLFPALAAVVAFRAVLAWCREACGFRAGSAVRSRVRDALVAHIARLGPAFVSRRQAGALAATAMEQVEALHAFYAHYLPQTALAVAVPAAILCAVFPVSWAAGGLLLVSAPLIPLFMILVGMGAESISQRNFQALSHLSAHFLDALRGLPTLKLFDRSKAEALTVAEASRRYRVRTMQVLRVAFLSSAVLEFFSALSIALVAVYLGLSYLGYLDFGSWGRPLDFAGGLFVLVLAPDFYLSLRELGTHYHARADAMGAAGEILAVLDLPAPPAGAEPVPWEEGRCPELRAEGLTLSYDEGKRPALRGVSFSLAPGEHVALVGASGSGKTSVLDLFLGFCRPDGGALFADGRRADAFRPDEWRSLLAWIGQRPVLFFGSIRDNIRLGRPGAGEAEVEAAALAARVSEFADELDAGLDTPVGEEGRELSRGQAQRVALARAFLKDAPVLLLDEPTAGLDRENERLVMEALSRLGTGRTVLVATHRLQGLQAVDRILVMDRGRIVESGTFAELASGSGRFAAMLGRFAEGQGHG
jgi:ATP-binding cassette subfamily C protein CydD